MFKTLLIAFLVGGFTNLIVEAKNNGGLVFPHKLKTKLRLGFIDDFLIGGFAGMLFVAFVEPETLFKIISLSILGGFGGIATLERLYGKSSQITENQNEIIKNRLDKKLEK